MSDVTSGQPPEGICSGCSRFAFLDGGYCTPCLIRYEREEREIEEREAAIAFDRGLWIDDDGGIRTHAVVRRTRLSSMSRRQLRDAARQLPHRCPGGRDCECCGPDCECGCRDECPVFIRFAIPILKSNPENQ